MKVWIDQDLCTGDGLCEVICPEVFSMGPDGLAYVGGRYDVGGAAHVVDVGADSEDLVVEAAEECPGECIFVET